MGEVVVPKRASVGEKRQKKGEMSGKILQPSLEGDVKKLSQCRFKREEGGPNRRGFKGGRLAGMNTWPVGP